jgi:hypothetical protein
MTIDFFEKSIDNLPTYIWILRTEKTFMGVNYWIFKILITYPDYWNFIQVDYQSYNPKHVYKKKFKKKK